MAGRTDAIMVSLTETLKEIKSDVKDARSEINNIKTAQALVNEALIGNGHEGLIKQVSRHDKYISEEEGRKKFINLAMGSGWLLTILGLFFSIIIYLRTIGGN